MQSAARKLKRVSAGKQNEKSRHNNRKRTQGRIISYVNVLQTEKFKVPVEKTYINKKGVTIKRILNKISCKRIEGLALLNKLKSSLKDNDRLADLKKVTAFMNDVLEFRLLKKAKYKFKEKIDELRFEKLASLVEKRRPTVICSIYIFSRIFKQKLIFRTSPVHAGLMNGFA